MKLGSGKTLDQLSGGVPKMGSALKGWTQKLVFNLVVKVTENGITTETTSELRFSGVWQPLTAQKLMIKPEGQRAWKWYMVHTWTDIELKPDDILYYKDTRYRVMEKLNYEEYEYYEYHIVEDYE